MQTVIAHYRTRPDAADENQRLVERVFAQLAEDDPGGLRYAAFRLADGVTFVHVATIEGRATHFRRRRRSRISSASWPTGAPSLPCCGRPPLGTYPAPWIDVPPSAGQHRGNDRRIRIGCGDRLAPRTPRRASHLRGVRVSGGAFGRAGEARRWGVPSLTRPGEQHVLAGQPTARAAVRAAQATHSTRRASAGSPRRNSATADGPTRWEASAVSRTSRPAGRSGQQSGDGLGDPRGLRRASVPVGEFGGQQVSDRGRHGALARPVEGRRRPGEGVGDHLVPDAQDRSPGSGAAGSRSREAPGARKPREPAPM